MFFSFPGIGSRIIRIRTMVLEQCVGILGDRLCHIAKEPTRKGDGTLAGAKGKGDLFRIFSVKDPRKSGKLKEVIFGGCEP